MAILLAFAIVNHLRNADIARLFAPNPYTCSALYYLYIFKVYSITFLGHIFFFYISLRSGRHSSTEHSHSRFRDRSQWPQCDRFFVVAPALLPSARCTFSCSFISHERARRKKITCHRRSTLLSHGVSN